MGKAHISYTSFFSLSKIQKYTPNMGKLKIILAGKTNATLNIDAFKEGKENCIRRDDVSLELDFDEFIWKGELSDLKEILKDWS